MGRNNGSEKWLYSRYSLKIQSIKSAESLDVSVKEIWEWHQDFYLQKQKEWFGSRLKGKITNYFLDKVWLRQLLDIIIYSVNKYWRSSLLLILHQLFGVDHSIGYIRFLPLSSLLEKETCKNISK